MALHVEICDDVLETIQNWGLPPEVYQSLLRTMLSDLETKLSDKIGQIHSVAPVRLRRYCLAIPDPGGGFIHNFVFLVNESRGLRRVMLGNYRTGGHDFAE